MALPTLVVPDVRVQFEALFARWAQQDFSVPRDVETKVDIEEYQHDFTAEIELGVATLDAVHGRTTWLSRVNLGTLDVYGEDTCVVGQTTRNVFYEGVEQLGGPSINLKDSDEKVDEQVDRVYAWTDARGFTTNDKLCDEHGEKFMFRQLTDQWVVKIAALRTEVA